MSGLKAPNTKGSYNIQSHFAGDSLHGPKDSATVTLQVLGKSGSASAATSPQVTTGPSGTTTAKGSSIETPNKASSINQSVASTANNKPVANDLSKSTSINEALPISLSGTDLDGDQLTFSIIDSPEHGKIKNFKSSKGTLTYVPQKDYLGEDKFTFNTNDGKTDSNLGYVSIVIQGVQQLTKQEGKDTGTETQSPTQSQVTSPQLIDYWIKNKDKTERLLPLTIGQFKVDNLEKMLKVVNITSDDHNIYDNVAAQILASKFNIKNGVTTCDLAIWL